MLGGGGVHYSAILHLLNPCKDVHTAIDSVHGGGELGVFLLNRFEAREDLLQDFGFARGCHYRLWSACLAAESTRRVGEGQYTKWS